MPLLTTAGGMTGWELSGWHKGTKAVEDRDHQVGQAVVEVKMLLARYHLVPVQEALQRLVVDAAFEFRVAEIENAVEHGGKGLLNKRVPTQIHFKSRDPLPLPTPVR